MPMHTPLAEARSGYVGLAPTKTSWCSTFNAFAHIRGPTSAGRPFSGEDFSSPFPFSGRRRRIRNTRHAFLHGLQLHLRNAPRVRNAEAMGPEKLSGRWHPLCLPRQSSFSRGG
ncbi:unnamed protein product [Parnassius mnemosyne]|uniref:Uncharacterized protein n=1 Tax=Parnassius mnemosyne TaxID=213953 RepID=A0AAV1KJL7_9NEOP